MQRSHICCRQTIDERRSAFTALREVLEAPGPLTATPTERLQRVAALFGVGSEPPGMPLSGCRASRRRSRSGRPDQRKRVRKCHELTTLAGPSRSKYDRLIAARRAEAPAATIVAHPCDETSLRGAIEAAEMRAHRAGPCGAGRQDPRGRRRSTGSISAECEIVDAPHSHAAAAKAVEIIREGRGDLLMKGSLHTDELMRDVPPPRPAFGPRGGSAMSS